ncbi:MAG TPA: phenylalanine--tRNA ligase beta subunit-related protein [Ktedonobacterales bacterium]|nr:phenylalanine--tRNA ligase beta subunit-related protein [Ktedonobacterales bacterium]
MIQFDIGEVVERFPAFRVGMVVATGLRINSGRPESLQAQITEVERSIRDTIGDLPLGDVPELGIWRETYKQFGVKKTSFRSSVERLVKKVRQGDDLPRINTLVDAYNLISLRYRMPVGADDLDRIVSPVSYRIARPGETFIPLGDPTGADDPPLPGEVVYADGNRVMCRRWNWYQDARSAISTGTTRALLNVEAIEPTSATQVERASAALAELLADVCGAQTTWQVFDAKHPSGALERPASVARIES